LLVLSRKPGERIRLQMGTEIVWITIVAVDGGKVRVGVEAAMSVHVAREELLPEAERFTNGR
jgi:carbon storage regulator CsrA